MHLLEEVLADGKNVDGDVRAEPTDLLFVVVRRLSDVLVLKVSVHRDVTLKSVKKKTFEVSFTLAVSTSIFTYNTTISPL